MNKLTLGAAIAALSLAVPSQALAQRNAASPVLIVDINRVSTECTACRVAASQLQTMVTAYEQRQQQLGQQLETVGKPLETAVGALNGRQPDAALQSRLQAYGTQRQSAAQEIQTRGQQLASTEAHVNQQIADRLRIVLEQIRSGRNATAVIAKGATWASNPTADVTNEALALLNQQLPSVSVTPLPQQAGTQPTQPRPTGR